MNHGPNRQLSNEVQNTFVKMKMPGDTARWFGSICPRADHERRCEIRLSRTHTHTHTLSVYVYKLSSSGWYGACRAGLSITAAGSGVMGQLSALEGCLGHTRKLQLGNASLKGLIGVSMLLLNRNDRCNVRTKIASRLARHGRSFFHDGTGHNCPAQQRGARFLKPSRADVAINSPSYHTARQVARAI